MKIIVKKHPETNQVITQSSTNAEWGVVRVSQEAFEISNGIINKRSRSAFVRAKLDVLNALGLADGQEFPLPGKIVVKESTTPFFEGQSAKVNPTTGEEMMLDGNPIYRQAEFTSDLNEQDILLAANGSKVSVASGAEAKALV